MKRVMPTGSSFEPPGILSNHFDDNIGEDDYFSNPWVAGGASQQNTLIDADTPWYMAPKTALDAILVFLCILAFCSGVIGNLLCIVAFCFRRRSCLTGDVGLIAIYIAVLFLLIRSLSSFHLQFMVTSHTQYIDYQASKIMICVLPYTYAAVHMGIFYILTLVAALQYLNIAWPQYSLRPRHVVIFVMVITAFSFLVNIHFLLVHCRSFEYQLYIEYVKTVWLKFVFVDGSAFILAFFFLIRTLIAIRKSAPHLPDRHLLRDDCLAIMLVLFTYATPVFVDSLFALIELYSHDNRLSLRTIHFDLVLTLHVLSLASIPLVTATTRPATRLDVNGLFDRWRAATDACCFPRRHADDVNNSSDRVSFVQRLRISLSGVNGFSNGGAAAILGESSDGPTDDQMHILSVSPCVDDEVITMQQHQAPLAPPPSYNQLRSAASENQTGFATFASNEFHDLPHGS